MPDFVTFHPSVPVESIKDDSEEFVFKIGDLTFTRTILQEYSNCAFSAGLVEGHSVDTLYVALERLGEEPTIILLREDEALAMAWCLVGGTWSKLIERKLL